MLDTQNIIVGLFCVLFANKIHISCGSFLSVIVRSHDALRPALFLSVTIRRHTVLV